MRLLRIFVVTVAVLALAAAGVSAQEPPAPLGTPLFPDFLVSHATDGASAEGMRTRTDVFVTNAGRGPLAAELAFVPDAGLSAAPFALPAIAPGATAHVPLRAVVGTAAPAFVSGVVRVRFFLPAAPPNSAETVDVTPEPPLGVVAAYLTTMVGSAPGTPAPPPQTIALDVTPLRPLADRPPVPPVPPPCPSDHPCPGPDLACVPPPGAECEPPQCPADRPCPTPDHPCVPPAGTTCGSVSWKGVTLSGGK